MFGLGRLLVGFVQICSAVFGVGCCGEGGGGGHGGCTGPIPAPLFRHTRACRGYLDVRGTQAPRSLRGRVRGCSGLVGCVRFCSGCSGWVSGHSLSGRGDFGCSEAVRICSGLFGCVRGGLLRRGRRRRALGRSRVLLGRGDGITMWGEMGRRGGSGLGCCSRRDTRGKRGYDGSGGVRV